MSKPKIRFVNNLQSIIFVTVIVSLPIYLYLKYSKINLEPLSVWWLTVSFFTLGLLGQSFANLGACNSVKDLKNSEMERLRHSISKRQAMIKSAIVYYFLITLVIALATFSKILITPVFAVTIGNLIALVFSTWGAITDLSEASDFQNHVQQLTNQKNEKDRVQKKLKDLQSK